MMPSLTNLSTDHGENERSVSKSGGEISGAVVIDWARSLVDAQTKPAPQRLLSLLKAAGCGTHPQDDRFVIQPAVRLWCVGGLPAHELQARGMSLAEVARLTASTMGAAGSMSYLAMPGGTAEGVYQKVVVEHGHASVAHLVQVSLVVAGVTCAVENEFNSQRDLVHLARVTEARTDAQKSPPLVVLEPQLFSVYKQALDAITALVRAAEGQETGLSKKDSNEAINALFPAAKATMFVMTGTLRNLQKLLAAESDEGKEKEFRRALRLIRATLSPMWPELFATEDAPGASDTGGENATNSTKGNGDKKTKLPAQGPAARQVAPEWEQHWVNPAALDAILSQLPLAGRSVLELGAGTGNLTRGLLAHGASEIEAWEIDPGLPAVDDARVRWRIRDIGLIQASDLANRAVVSFPPYSLLPQIKAALDEAKTPDAVLMVSARWLASFAEDGWRVIAELAGADFEPVSRGVHFVVAKGLSPA